MSDKTVTSTKIGHYFPMITEILEKHFGDYKVKVYLYGSRARKEEHAASDIDLAVKSSGSIDYQISVAKEAFFESHIPYKVDLVDFKTAGKNLKESIKKDGVLIWQS
ncbi:MAG TPA: nucleotidyltransferase domain-containing protein [Balneolaceae bacterium]